MPDLIPKGCHINVKEILIGLTVKVGFLFRWPTWLGPINPLILSCFLKENVYMTIRDI